MKNIAVGMNATSNGDMSIAIGYASYASEGKLFFFFSLFFSFSLHLLYDWPRGLSFFLSLVLSGSLSFSLSLSLSLISLVNNIDKYL